MLSNLFWEFRQQGMIRSAEDAAMKSAHRAGEAKQEARWLEDRVDKLTLVCMAMWTLIQEKTDLTEEDLLDKVREIDLQDGEADGKLRKSISRCASCDRVMSPRHKRCMYCGAERLSPGAFDATM